jgi:phosphatidylserine decarboxylase
VRISLGLLVAGTIFILLGLKILGAIVVLIAIPITLFFRDPDRFPAKTENVVISGADGKITDIAEVSFPGAGGAVYHRVSVFMSPLNVHVNRAPVGGEIISVRHTPGAFHAAFRDHASEHNERNLIVLSDARGRQHAMVQVAGYLARRIVCRLHPHDTVRCGERIGLIMFGSRVDHFIPPDYRVVVKIGEKVRAGESIIGELLQ